MNKAQRKLVILWVISLIIFILMVINSDWIVENWKGLQLPVIILISIAVVFSKRCYKWGDGSKKTNDAVQRYPIIKTWLAVYGIAIAAGIFITISKNIDLIEKFGNGGVFIAIAPIFLPFLIVEQIDRYRALGEQSNN